MLRKPVFVVTFLVVLLGFVLVAHQPYMVKASGTIYIRANGLVEGTDKIITIDNVTYTFTDNINDSIVVERSKIIIDGNGYTLQGNGSGNGFYLYGINNVTIKNTTIKYFDYGIWLYYSSNNSISGNKITATSYYGIWLDSSFNNTISGNNIANNHTRGIYVCSSSNNSISGNNMTANGGNGIVLYSSFNNTISGNNIANNAGGIVLYSSFNNTISGNNIANNHCGILLDSSSSNCIYHNNFMDNIQQADSYPIISGYANIWDDGYPSGGNYWSDYNGTDMNYDGIGDTSYTIDANNTDQYPLMGMFHSYDISWVDPQSQTLMYGSVTLISNSSISSFIVRISLEHPEDKAIFFNVSGITGTGFCRLCIPKAFMSPPYTIKIDGGQTPVLYYNETLYDNGTNRWIYFTYLHTEHQIMIFPEFPSFLILPIFMMATLLAVIVYRKKYH
jgi:parallel beta-helix repeat protein